MLALRDKLKPLGLKVFTHPGKNIYLWPVWFFTTFGQTTGNKSVERTAEILSGKGKFTDADVVKALDLLFQFGKDGLITQDAFSMDSPQALADFSAGHAAFWLQHESLISQIAADKPAELDLDVMLMPKLVDGDVKSQYPGGPSGIVGVNSKSDPDRQAAAQAFVDWGDDRRRRYGRSQIRQRHRAGQCRRQAVRRRHRRKDGGILVQSRHLSRLELAA